MAAKGSALKGALASAPKGRVTSMPVAPRPIPLGKPNAAAGAAAGVAQGAGLQRLSPGVYRSAQGQLVNSKGGALPGQQPRQPVRPPVAMPGQQAINSVLAGVSQGANQAASQFQQQPEQQQPMWRQPAPLPQQGGFANYYTGGSQNFNELTGQYNFPQQSFGNQSQSGVGYGVGAAFGGQPTSMPQQQYDTGFYDYMKSRAAQAQPLSAEQQAAAMAQQQTYAQQPQQPMMPQQPMYKGNVY